MRLWQVEDVELSRHQAGSSVLVACPWPLLFPK